MFIRFPIRWVNTWECDCWIAKTTFSFMRNCQLSFNVTVPLQVHTGNEWALLLVQNLYSSLYCLRQNIKKKKSRKALFLESLTPSARGRAQSMLATVLGMLVMGTSCVSGSCRGQLCSVAPQGCLCPTLALLFPLLLLPQGGLGWGCRGPICFSPSSFSSPT